MPNTREMELWRLVNKAFQNSIEKFGDIFAKDVTRDLLANGVTVQDNTEISNEFLEQLRNAPLTVLHEEPTIEVVQKWIPVTERLPDAA